MNVSGENLKIKGKKKREIKNEFYSLIMQRSGFCGGGRECEVSRENA